MSENNEYFSSQNFNDGRIITVEKKFIVRDWHLFFRLIEKWSGETVIRGIVFDFDMTLVDSSRGIWGNLNALAREKNLRPLDLPEVRKTIGWALVDAMRSFWGDGPIETEWLPRYRSLFVERNYADVLPFPETLPALEALSRRSIALGIATNRLTPLGIVRAAGLDKMFPVIVGIDKLKPKPDPGIVLEALRQMGLSRDDALYVGDTDIDMETANRAGVRGVGCATCNHDEAALRASGAAYTVKNLSELPALVEGLK